MKKIIATALALGLMAPALPAKELRLSMAPPPNSPWGAVAQKFVDKVAALSGGDLTINAFMASKLGGEQDVIKQIARGRIDMGVMSNTAVSLAVPEFGLLASPYAFETAEQFDCVADNHLLDTFGADFEAAGIRAVSWMEVGYQIISTKEAARVPADIANMKVRTAPSVTDNSFVKATGATAVPLSPKDTIPSLKAGTVDGASQVSVFGFVTGYTEVTPNFIMTRHQHQVGAVVISEKTWNSLSDQEQGWISEAAPIFLELRGMIRGAEGGLAKKAAADGTTIVELTDEELAQWKALVPAAQDAILSDMGDKAVSKWDEILAAKAACGSS